MKHNEDINWEYRLVMETYRNATLTPARNLFIGKVSTDKKTGEMFSRPICVFKIPQTMPQTREAIKELLEDMATALDKDVMVEQYPQYEDQEDIT